MPTYDYQCSACEHAFEVFQSISAPVKRKCPACGERKLKRLIGAGAAVVFRGSGFYQTDYRSESYKKRAAEDTSGSTSGKTEKGSDSANSSSSSSSSSATPAASKSEKKSSETRQAKQ